MAEANPFDPINPPTTGEPVRYTAEEWAARGNTPTTFTDVPASSVPFNATETEFARANANATDAAYANDNVRSSGFDGRSVPHADTEPVTRGEFEALAARLTALDRGGVAHGQPIV